MTTRADAGSGKRELPESVLLAASDWHLRIQDDPDDLKLRGRFESWLTSDPTHQRAWAGAQCPAYPRDASSPCCGLAGTIA